jgi:hypothetical protein
MAMQSRVASQPIGRTADAPPPAVEHMRVEDRRLDVVMPEQLLHRANVISVLEQVRRKRMPKRVARRALAYPRPDDRVSYGPLDHRLMHMMTKRAPLLTVEEIPVPGKIHCQAHDCSAVGCFRAKAPGSFTLPRPWSTSTP